MATFKNSELQHSDHAVMKGEFVGDEVIITISESHNKRHCELRLSVGEWQAFRFYSDTSHPLPSTFVEPSEEQKGISSFPVVDNESPTLVSQEPNKTLAEKIQELNEKKVSSASDAPATE